MKRAPLSFIDQAFLAFETEASPKHIAGLFVFKKPEGCGRNYTKDLYKQVVSDFGVTAPFSLKLGLSPRSGYCWKEDADIEWENHVFFHKLPARATQKDLLDFVGDLHTPLLDRTRPLWEAHFIDGVSGGHFGLYTKVHHAYGDGVSFTKLFSDGLAKKPSDTVSRILWNTGTPFQYGKPENARFGERLRSFLKTVGAPARAMIGLNRITLMLWMERLGFTKNAIAIPFTSARSPLTGQVTQGRQLACATVSMERIAAVRRRTRSTLNHVALTCVDGALRSYLNEIGADIDKPISIQMPVNLRTKNDRPGGNKIGIVLVELSPKTEDPYVRLREIGITLRGVRHQVDTLPDTSIVAYGVLISTIAQLAESFGISNWLPPLGNTLVSNVPGPTRTLYLRDASLAEYYPISALPPGLKLNITLFSYAGQLNFGLIASKDSMPNLHRLAEHIEMALTELEEAIQSDPVPKKANGRASAKKKKIPTKKKAKRRSRKVKVS